MNSGIRRRVNQMFADARLNRRREDNPKQRARAGDAALGESIGEQLAASMQSHPARARLSPE